MATYTVRWADKKNYEEKEMYAQLSYTFTRKEFYINILINFYRNWDIFHEIRRIGYLKKVFFFLILNVHRFLEQKSQNNFLKT